MSLVLNGSSTIVNRDEPAGASVKGQKIGQKPRRIYRFPDSTEIACVGQLAAAASIEA